jgi:hypothetical protein
VPSTGVYWWRSRAVKTNGQSSDWEYATFSIAPSSQPEFCYNSGEQLASTVQSGLAIQNSKLYLPLQDTVRYEVISHAYNDSNAFFQSISQILINDRPVFQFTEQGYVIAKLTPDANGIDTAYEFPIDFNRYGDTSYTAPIARAFDSVVASIPRGIRVIVLTNGQPAFPGITDNPNVLEAMQSLGSQKGLTIAPDHGSYALIGIKDSTVPALEKIAPEYSNGVHLYDTIVTYGTSGTAITPFTAVSRGYGTFTWMGDAIPSGSSVTFSILGSRRDGSGVDLLDTVRAAPGQQTSSRDLSNIDSRRYDRLAVRMDFARTSNATQSPAISDVELGYNAAPEFIFTSDSLNVSPSQTPEGGVVVARYGIATLTCAAADSIAVPLVRQINGKTDTLASHVVPHLDGHSSYSFTDSITTLGQQGVAALLVTVNPNEAQNEQLLYNNSISGAYTVTRDTAKPHTEILFDEEHIPSYGFVSPRDTILIDLYSPNFIRVTDTTAITAQILPESDPASFVQVSAADPHGYQVRFFSFPSGPLQAALQIVPITPFSPGKWDVTAYTKDASGNLDTVFQTFTVSAVNGLAHVMNYPNPFKDKTYFTFVLLSDAPASVKIIVYTIAGRKIRTLVPSNLRAGFNMAEWDGRDEQGNDVANGTYLYRVTINGTNPDGSTVSDAVTEKAVRSR